MPPKAQLAELGIQSKLQLAFNELGVTKGVERPEFVAPKGNNDPFRYVRLHELAWEYFCAHCLASAAEKRKDIAKKACQSIGMLDAESIGPGGSGVLHETPDLIITCTKKNPATRLDEPSLRNHLALKLKLSQQQIDDAIKSSMKENAPATSFTMIWKT